MHTRAERWRLAAIWFNDEVDNLLAEGGGTPGDRMDPPTQALLIYNILATHLREVTLDPALLEELCKVCVKAGITEPLIGATIEAFCREHGPRPEEVRKN